MGAPEVSEKKRKIAIPDGEALSLDEMKVSRQRLLDQSKLEKQATERISSALKDLLEVLKEERDKEHIPLNSDEFDRCKVRAEVTAVLENRDGQLPESVIKAAKDLHNFLDLFEQRLPQSKQAKKKQGKDNRDRERERERDFPPKAGNKNVDLRRTVEELQRRVAKLEDQVKQLKSK